MLNWLVLLALAAVIGLWIRWELRRRRDAFGESGSRFGAVARQISASAGVDTFTPAVARRPRRSQTHETLIAAFRSDEMPVPPEIERADQRVIVRALRFAADRLGARECALWRQTSEEDELLELVASSRGAPPELTEIPKLTMSEESLVLWSVIEQVGSGDTGGEGSVQFLVAPVMLNHARGAVSAQFGEEPTAGRTQLRLWLERHAAEISTLHDFVRMRAELARSNRRLRATVQTAKTLQGSRDPLQLEELLSNSSLSVADAAWGALVRWDAERSVGELRTQTADAPEFAVRAEARRGSLVGDVCASGAMRVYQDTRPVIASGEPLFDGVPLTEGTGSLLIVPIRRSDNEPVLGALVCGHPAPGALNQNDARAARELGVIAAGALDTAWAVHEATERARTDQLTGLHNRRHFDEQFARMIGETDRFGGASALIIADIDHFKRVNDTYGHETGDTVLKQVAHALASERRTTDSAARIGGEEIALLLPQTDATGALEVAERLRERIEELRVHTSQGDIQVTASFGIAMYTARSNTGARLFERADRALYAAKGAGRNRVEMAPADGEWTASG